MAYTQMQYLKDMGFLPTSAKRYSSLGKTYYLDNAQISGYYWTYGTEDYSFSIHDFHVKKDITLPQYPLTGGNHPIHVAYIKTGYGECVHPAYSLLQDNTVYTFSGDPHYAKFILYKGFPYFSVNVEYTEHFWEKYIPETLKIRREDVKKALQALGQMPTMPQFMKIADELTGYRDAGPGSELFYEAKAKELLGLTFNMYFEKKKDPDDNEDDLALERVREYIEQNYTTHVKQSTLCNIALMGKTKLKETFKAKYGMTITEYIQRHRIRVAEHMLVHTEYPISQVALSVGYSSHSRFSALFKKYKNMHPKDFRAMYRKK